MDRSDFPPLGRARVQGWGLEEQGGRPGTPWEAVLTTEDRSTFSTLLSCSSTGCRPATWSCTEDVRYTNLSSQSPLRGEEGVNISLGAGSGCPGQGWAPPGPGEASEGGRGPA